MPKNRILQEGGFPLSQTADCDVCKIIRAADVADVHHETVDRTARFYFIGKHFTDMLEQDLFQKPFFRKSLIETFDEKITDDSRQLSIDYPWGEAFITAHPWVGPGTAQQQAAFAALISDQHALPPASLAYSMQVSLDQHSMYGFWEDEQCDRVPEALLGRTPLCDLVEVATATPSVLFGSEGAETYLKIGYHIKGLEHLAGDVFLGAGDYYVENPRLFPQSAHYLCRRSEHVKRILELRSNHDSTFEFSLPYIFDFMGAIGNGVCAYPQSLDAFRQYALTGTILMPEKLAVPRGWKQV